MIEESTPNPNATDRMRFALVQSLFRDTLRLPEQERCRFLEKACEGDSVLLTEILGMLEEDARGAPLLDGGIAGVAQQILSEDFDFAQHIGPYQLVRMLGEGGMGVVYLAERSDFGNPVAIKFLRDAWLSPIRRERFLSEQRLLAPLNHPSIARFYDSGTLANNVPWFAMEYVEGMPLTDYCRAHECTIEQRLHLFRCVCEAVQYAHVHAVIHRDLKPSNILVKADGSVRLLDFGIAKQVGDFIDQVDQTLTGLRMLTPAYAAPEQIRGEPVGVFTDVYALGLILYELLSGRPPFDLSKRTPEEAGRMIIEVEAEKPSAIRTLAGVEARQAEWTDIDVLCLKAIHKDVQRRYRSVEAVVRDIDHYLAGEPLEARADSLRYRLNKFVRRNCRVVTAVAAVVFCVIAITSFFTIRLASARNTAVAAVARQQRVQQFMLALFNGGEKAAGPAKDLRVLTLIHRGVQEARSLDREPAIQADLYETLGAIYEKLGAFTEADLMLRLALGKRASLLGQDSLAVAQSQVELGLLRIDQAKFNQAETFIQEGLKKAKHARPINKVVLAYATAALGKVREARGDYKNAIPLLDEAIKLQSVPVVTAADLAATIKELADAHFYAGHYNISEELTRRAMAMHLQAHGEKHPLVADDLVNLGAIHIEKGNYPEAERYYRKALDINQSWYGRDHPETAGNLYMLGEALVDQKRYSEAEPLLQDALAIRERVYGSMHPRNANVLNELCIVASEKNLLDKAAACYGRVIAIYKTAYGDHHYLVGLGIANLATVYMIKGEYSRAENGFRDALARYHQTLSADHLYVGIAQVKLGHVLFLQKRYAEAKQPLLTGYDVIKNQTSQSVSWMQSASKDLVIISKLSENPAPARASGTGSDAGSPR